jgi:hypothetical protein
MFERITVPGLSDDENATLNLLLERLEAKMPRNLLRASYYDGKRAISQVGTVIPPQYYRLGLCLGWTAKAVDLLARRCNLDGWAWPGGDLDSLGVRELAAANREKVKVNSAVISSLIHATSFLITTKGGDGEPPALLHVKNAMNATGQWNERKGALDNLLSVVKRDDDGRPVQFALYLDGLTITAKKDGGGWSVDRQEHPWGMPAEPLVYKTRTGREFGMSRISRPIMALQDAALRELIRLEGHMDVYSYPEMWMLGADPSIFKNADGSPKANWQVMLGRIKGVPDDQDAQSDTLARADVKQFPATSPAPHLADLNALAKLMAREASLPDTALAITDVSNPTSAESYDASQYELIAEAEGATEEWTVPLQRAQVRLLAIANGANGIPPEWSTIAPKWRNPRYLSRSGQADAGMKQLSAVPWLAETRVGLELLGLDEQQQQRALAEKRRAQAQAALANLRALPNVAGG